MTTNKISRYLKAGAAVLACIGVTVSPEQTEAITGGFLALYAVFSAVQAKLESGIDADAVAEQVAEKLTS